MIKLKDLIANSLEELDTSLPTDIGKRAKIYQ